MKPLCWKKARLLNRVTSLAKASAVLKIEKGWSEGGRRNLSHPTKVTKYGSLDVTKYGSLDGRQDSRDERAL